MAKPVRKEKQKGSSANGVHGAGRRKKYERTTPVGRVIKNFVKAQLVTSYALDRLRSWESSGEPRIKLALSKAASAELALTQARDAMASLFGEKWTPPKKSLAITFSDGEEVKIHEKYLPKYSSIYAASVLGSLVVVKTLPTGEVAVRSGSQSPFLVAKSHIERRPSEAGGAE